ncbi:GDSL-type esterase/lipase family protein [Symbioplanes lichenis]|uniref:GDSL-type esterase/lipase family protein n=1 Tax=Symbioplanes lichenis TaxID=1629072 RepID=UPI002739B3FA|nr:GDSL-type esterase/lipase family protein [Actinoplanes lichenis]
MRRLLPVVLTLVLAACTPQTARQAAPAVTTPAPVAPIAWTTGWAAAPAAAVRYQDAGYTVRNVVHLTAGGSAVRVHLTNRLGDKPLVVGHATVALRAYQGKARAGTLRSLTFGGRRAVTIRAGAGAVSDPARLAVPAQADLLVSVWVPKPVVRVTTHPTAMQDSYVSRSRADHAADLSGRAFGEVTRVWHYVSEVDVAGGPGTVVALGDSITDGIRSGRNDNARWTDCLAARLRKDRRTDDYGVANAGITGNRILLDAYWPHYTVYQDAGPRALSRADDAFGAAGARTVIILLGINDIQQWPHQRAEAVIAGLRRLMARARADGLRVVVGTLTPWYGWKTWTAGRERTRLAVNKWIRTTGAVADFDAAVRDPDRPRRMRREFDSGDHIHPNAAGDAALAAAVPLGKL